MENINYEKNDIDILLNQAQLILNNYLTAIKEKSQLSSQECEMIQIGYANLLLQIKSMLETLNAANISLQQIEFNSNRERKDLDKLYNSIDANKQNNPLIETICGLYNELNSLENLPATTISEIQKKYFLMNNHFMKTSYFVNSINQPQQTKYKKPKKNTVNNLGKCLKNF